MISFFLIPFYVRVLTTEDYGIIDLITRWFQLSQVFYFHWKFTRQLPGFSRKVKKNKKRRTHQPVCSFTFLPTFYSQLTVIFFATPLSNILFNVPGKEAILKLAVISILITSVFNYFQNLLRYSLKSVKYSISNIYLFTNYHSVFNIFCNH